MNKTFTIVLGQFNVLLLLLSFLSLVPASQLLWENLEVGIKDGEATPSLLLILSSGDQFGKQSVHTCTLLHVAVSGSSYHSHGSSYHSHINVMVAE